MKLNSSKVINGQKLTPEYEKSQEFKDYLKSIGSSLEEFNKWRDNNKNVDLSVYTVKQD